MRKIVDRKARKVVEREKQIRRLVLDTLFSKKKTAWDECKGVQVDVEFKSENVPTPLVLSKVLPLTEKIKRDNFLIQVGS